MTTEAMKSDEEVCVLDTTEHATVAMNTDCELLMHLQGLAMKSRHLK